MVKKPVEQMSFPEVAGELREGQWVSSRNEEEWDRRMKLWARLDAFVATQANARKVS